MRRLVIAAVAVAVALGAPTAFAQSVPDTIAVEGVPEVPRELVRQLRKYQNVRLAAFQDWVAGKREMLVLTRFADVPEVHHVARPGGARSQLTFLPERVLSARARPGKADQFLFVADEGGAENYQVSLFDARTGDDTRLSDGASRHGSARWSNSGKQVAWTNNARNGRDMDVYVLDADDPRGARRLVEVKGDWAVADWSPDDSRVAAVEGISINESYVHWVDVATGKVETITPRPKDGEQTVAYDDVKWSKDGKALFATTDDGSEFRHLVRYDLGSKQFQSFTDPNAWDVDTFDLSDDGRWVAYTANEGGVGRLHLRDLTLQNEAPAPPLPAGQVAGLKFRRGSHEVGFTLNSARSPSDAYSFDIDTGKLDRWTTGETGGLDLGSFVEPELAHFDSFDGKSIPAFVYRPGPKFAGPRPVLIEIHGGPESQFRPGFLARANYLINELGIALVFPNVRGSAGYGKTYLKLDNGRLREDSVKDIGALLDWVAKQPGMDAARVGVAGGSYGGYMSLATLTHYGDRLKAGLDVVGISNFVTFLKNTQDYRRDLRRVEYGDERDAAMRSFLEEISPLSKADKIRTPLLIVQGKNDPRVPLGESEQMLAAVRKNGGPVWYVLGKNEGHGFAKKRNQDYLQAAEVLFWKTYLIGDGR